MSGMLLLAFAIIGEVFASTMLKFSEGFKKFLPTIGVAIGYGVAFYGLAMALESIPLGVAYAIWSGIGTAATVLIGITFFKESANRKKFFGVVLIILGVVLLNLETPIN